MIAAEPDPGGPLRVWVPPQPGEVYVIGADPAEGIEGGDFSAAWVINGMTKEHCATYHYSIDPVPFAQELAWLGEFYNGALLVPESNNHGESVIRELVHHVEYPNIYERRVVSDQRGTSMKKTNTKHGFHTNHQSRQLLVDTVRAVVRRKFPIYDHRFYAEGLTWVLDDKGRASTADGANDDVLFAAGLAYLAAQEQYGGALIPKPASVAPTERQKHYQEKRKTWQRILERTQEHQRESVSPAVDWSQVPPGLR